MRQTVLTVHLNRITAELGRQDEPARPLANEPARMTPQESLTHLFQMNTDLVLPSSQGFASEPMLPPRGPPRLQAAKVYTVWADALCLNQADKQEKSLQVPRIGTVFRCLLVRPYWQRVWIVQELAVASPINLYCGRSRSRGEKSTPAASAATAATSPTSGAARQARTPVGLPC